MQLTQVYKRRYVIPGQQPKTYYTIRLPHGVHRSIWVGTEDMSFESSAAYRWLQFNRAIDWPSKPQEATEALGGTSGAPECSKPLYRIVVVDCIPKKKVRKKSTRGSKI